MNANFFSFLLSAALLAGCATGGEQVARDELRGMGIDHTKGRDFDAAIESGDAKIIGAYFRSYNGFPCSRGMTSEGTWCPRDRKVQIIDRAIYAQGHFHLLAIFDQYDFDRDSINKVTGAIATWAHDRGKCMQPEARKFIQKHKGEIKPSAGGRDGSMIRSLLERGCFDDVVFFIDQLPDQNAVADELSMAINAITYVIAKQGGLRLPKEKSDSNMQNISSIATSLNSRMTGKCKSGDLETCGHGKKLVAAKDDMIVAYQSLLKKSDAMSETKARTEAATKAAFAVQQAKQVENDASQKKLQEEVKALGKKFSGNEALKNYCDILADYSADRDANHMAQTECPEVSAAAWATGSRNQNEREARAAQFDRDVRTAKECQRRTGNESNSLDLKYGPKLKRAKEKAELSIKTKIEGRTFCCAALPDRFAVQGSDCYAH